MPRNQDIIAIYSRKSRFTGKGESIGNQVELCRAYIRTAFGEACADGAVIFEDEGFSGGNLNRPDFKRMMRAARDHQFKAVVVYRLDRISRNISDFSALIQELGRLEIDFVSIRESFDTSSPMGRAMMYIASVFSQLERETIAERIRDNMHELAKTGRWLGGITPTGYTSEAVKAITVDGKSKRACKLKLIPREADVVRKIYELYCQTDSLTMTEAQLLREQIKTKTGRDFTRFAIKGILQNPVYLIADQEAYQYFVEKQAALFSGPEEFDGVRGMLAYNRTDQEKGRATVYLPVSEWIVSVGQHPGLIPAKTWIGVQNSLERNKSKAYRKPRSNQALLVGVLWCRCGSRMYPKLSQRVGEDGKPIYTYVCKGKEHSKGCLCHGRNANGNVLDEMILEQVKRLSSDGSSFLAQLEKDRRVFTGSREEEDKRLEELRQQQAETERKITALVDSLADFGDSTALLHVKKRIEELHAHNAGLLARITQLEELAAQQALSGLAFEERRQLLAVFRDSAGEMTVEQKRGAIRAVVRKVVWDGQWAHVVLFGGEDWGEESAPQDAPEKTPWGEDSKSYSIVTEQMKFENENFASCCEKWSVFCHLRGHRYVMIRSISYAIEVSPLIILHFPLLTPRKFLDAQIFNLRFSDPSEMTQIADKLRWYRYRHALLQSEVADRIGVDPKTYMRYEEYGRDYYPIEHMQKLAGMYVVPVESLLDDYNLFLYHDQGRQIRERRLSQKLTQKAYAANLGVSLDKLKKWEENRVRMFKSTWEKYFR